MSFIKFGLNENEPTNNDAAEETVKETKTKKNKTTTKCKDKAQNSSTLKSYPRKRKAKVPDPNEPKEVEKDIFHLTWKAQTRVPHSLVPSFNLDLKPIEKLADLPKHIYPNCKLTEPRPIYFAKKPSDILDPCFGRTRALETYYVRLNNVSSRYQNAWKNDRKLRKLVKDSVYHASLFTLAERLESNPDPYFYGNYDFYYTGGNLCTLPTETHNVVHVDSGDFGVLLLSTYSPCQKLEVLQECATKKMPFDAEIFEICSLKTTNEVTNLIGVRQLNNITMLSIDPQENSLKLLVELKTKHVPIISFAQSLEKPEMLVVSTLKEDIRLFDISRIKQTTLKNLYKLQKADIEKHTRWNQIKAWHGETFLYANDRQIFFIDFRAPEQDWLKNLCSFSNKEYPCEINTSMAISEFDNLFYIGTTHTLRCMDSRFIKENIQYERATVCEWTHQLDYPPAYLKVQQHNMHEYIACASQLAGDLRICQLTETKSKANKCDYESYCLPWQPPTLQEAFESACLEGKALQPEADLKKRIKACTTGLAYFKTKNGQVELLYSNSSGDIYAQKMQERQNDEAEIRISARSNEVIGNFAKELAKLQQPDLNYTEIADLKGIHKVLLCSNLNENLVKQEEAEVPAETEKSNTKRFKGRWQRSMCTLNKYKDALAQDLLSIWDIPYEDETDIKYSELKNKFKTEKSDKDVLNWLNRNENDVPPTTTIPISNLNFSTLTTMDYEDISGIELQAQSTQIVTNELDLTYKSVSGLLNNSNTTTIMESAKKLKIAKPKAAKAKKKHVKGF